MSAPMIFTTTALDKFTYLLTYLEFDVLKSVYEAWAPARGEQGGQAPTLEKIRVGMAHPGNFSRGLKTSWQYCE